MNYHFLLLLTTQGQYLVFDIRNITQDRFPLFIKYKKKDLFYSSKINKYDTTKRIYALTANGRTCFL